MSDVKTFLARARDWTGEPRPSRSDIVPARTLVDFAEQAIEAVTTLQADLAAAVRAGEEGVGVQRQLSLDLASRDAVIAAIKADVDAYRAMSAEHLVTPEAATSFDIIVRDFDRILAQSPADALDAVKAAVWDECLDEIEKHEINTDQARAGNPYRATTSAATEPPAWTDPEPYLIEEVPARYSVEQYRAWEDDSTAANLAMFKPRTREQYEADRTAPTEGANRG